MPYKEDIVINTTLINYTQRPIVPVNNVKEGGGGSGCRPDSSVSSTGDQRQRRRRPEAEASSTEGGGGGVRFVISKSERELQF